MALNSSFFASYSIHSSTVQPTAFYIPLIRDIQTFLLLIRFFVDLTVVDGFPALNPKLFFCCPIYKFTAPYFISPHNTATASILRSSFSSLTLYTPSQSKSLEIRPRQHTRNVLQVRKLCSRIEATTRDTCAVHTPVKFNQ